MRSARTRQSQLLHRQAGILATTTGGAWYRHWREPYLLLLSAPWPLFLTLLGAIYLVINILFALLYQLDPGGLAGTPTGRTEFEQAFFFSVQTLGSISYVALYPVSTYVNLIVTGESLVGLLFVALSTGLAFARFSRSSARIRFSELITVHSYNGQPTLSFRLANERQNNLLDARLKVFLALEESTEEGHVMRRMHPINLQRDQSLSFLLTWTAMHVIDGTSPLHNLTSPDLIATHAEILVAFSGVDETLERPVHARYSYSADQIHFHECFVDMLEGSGDQHLIDWSNFDQTRPCR
jgi:inward rectifier potassium channel